MRRKSLFPVPVHGDYYCSFKNDTSFPLLFPPLASDLTKRVDTHTFHGTRLWRERLVVISLKKTNPPALATNHALFPCKAERKRCDLHKTRREKRCDVTFF